MIQSHTSFDALLTTARDLALTVVAGRLWPPLDGHMSTYCRRKTTACTCSFDADDTGVMR